MSSIVVLPGGEWKPHYVGAYSREQIDIFMRQPHPYIDSRCVLERFRGPGIEVVLGSENPINGGVKVLIRPDGFFKAELVDGKPVPVEFTVWTISIPLMERLAHVYKGMRDRATGKYRVWCY